MTTHFIYTDGGRREAGFKGKSRDCVTRSIAIATGLPYMRVWEDLLALSQKERRSKRGKRKSHPSHGVYRPTADKYLKSLGWTWVATMGIGTGCKVHLDAAELPPGRLIISLSRHITCMVDGTIHDTYDCSRAGNRCVYGYWKEK